MSSLDLVQTVLTQYGKQLTDGEILQAIRTGDAKAAVARAKTLLRETPPPSRERLTEELIRGNPLSDVEGQASRLRRFVSAIESAMRFSSTVTSDLADVHSSTRR
jgi:hypothetical protein